MEKPNDGSPYSPITWPQVYAAADFALRTTIRGKDMGWLDRNFTDDPAGWSKAVEGACGERSLANHLKFDWWEPDFDGMQEPDMLDIDAKTRTHHNYDLILHEDSAREDRRYVLLTGMAPHFWVRGWINGYEAMTQKHLDAYRAFQRQIKAKPSKLNDKPGWLVKVNGLYRPRSLRITEEMIDAYRSIQAEKARKARANSSERPGPHEWLRTARHVQLHHDRGRG